jgi:hypothetical protein
MEEIKKTKISLFIDVDFNIFQDFFYYFVK